MDIYARLHELGITLPQPPAPGGIYTPCITFNHNMCYLSGVGPAVSVWNKPGKLGQELTIPEGQAAARAAALNMLAVLHRDLGDLNRIEKWVKVLGFVASAPTFYDQPATMNGFSQLILDVFGEKAGKPARSAIGAPCLPTGIAVEVEALVELNDYDVDLG